MRTINKIILHCTATPENRMTTVADIKRYHTAAPPKGRGWKDIGYHYIIYLDGSVHVGRPLAEAGAHTLNHNTDSIGIVYVGGIDEAGNPKDTRTPQQKQALRNLVTALKHVYPSATVHGHNEFAAKACPSFRVSDEF